MANKEKASEILKQEKKLFHEYINSGFPLVTVSVPGRILFQDCNREMVFDWKLTDLTLSQHALKEALQQVEKAIGIVCSNAQYQRKLVGLEVAVSVESGKAPLFSINK